MMMIKDNNRYETSNTELGQETDDRFGWKRNCFVNPGEKRVQ